MIIGLIFTTRSDNISIAILIGVGSDQLVFNEVLKWVQSTPIYTSDFWSTTGILMPEYFIGWNHGADENRNLSPQRTVADSEIWRPRKHAPVNFDRSVSGPHNYRAGRIYTRFGCWRPGGNYRDTCYYWNPLINEPTGIKLEFSLITVVERETESA